MRERERERERERAGERGLKSERAREREKEREREIAGERELQLKRIYRHNMTFEKSLIFWNVCECNVYCSFYCLFHFCLLSTSLALAMLTYAHANKDLELN